MLRCMYKLWFNNINARLTCEQNVCELWNIVHHMTDIPAVPSDSLAKSRVCTNMQMAFVHQALKYLQERLIFVLLFVKFAINFAMFRLFVKFYSACIQKKLLEQQIHMYMLTQTVLTCKW